ncbi:Pantothenate transporter liz1 [Cytospora mali]|uniref:Pantothenate transporter liz1 n=1 Tax=Cytospora mali TaxID=578113 RepID=A0A194UY18_CYTMA|nr:Pantothenate transporter liz1 [Valsa mali var. pyri (nom. inval.)]
MSEVTVPKAEKPLQNISEKTEGVQGDFSSGKKRQKSFWRSVQGYIWDDPDKSEYEKKFLLKLDIFLLSYTCLGYFCKNLDQANLSNAYVSGMKEALGMHGSQLTYMSNVFTAGYVVSQLPAVILVTKVRPSYIIPTLEILWSVFTFCSSAVKTVPQLYAMRFLVGLCEGAFFPTIIYLISSWYTKSERGKRVTLFYSTATMSSMFSGYLQAGAYDGLNGKLGHAGWQWLFIVCGVISLPVGVIGYFFNPDFPENTRAFYLTKEEAAFARQRLIDDGYKPLGTSAWDKKKIFRIIASWQFWVLSFGYFFVQCSYPGQQPFYSLYLKATNHTIYQINVWPTGQAAVGVVTQILAGMVSDSPLLRGRRWQAILVLQGGSIFGCIILAVWNVPIGLKYFAFYISWMSAGVPGIYYSWFPDLMPHDHEMRGFMTAFSNMFSYVNQIWYADAAWRTSEAPEFKPGFIACATFGVVLISTALLMRWLEIRDTGRRAIAAREEQPDTQLEGAGNVSESFEKRADSAV